MIHASHTRTILTQLRNKLSYLFRRATKIPKATSVALFVEQLPPSAFQKLISPFRSNPINPINRRLSVEESSLRLYCKPRLTIPGVVSESRSPRRGAAPALTFRSSSDIASPPATAASAAAASTSSLPQLPDPDARDHSSSVWSEGTPSEPPARAASGGLASSAERGRGRGGRARDGVDADVGGGDGEEGAVTEARSAPADALCRIDSNCHDSSESPAAAATASSAAISRSSSTSPAASTPKRAAARRDTSSRHSTTWRGRACSTRSSLSNSKFWWTPSWRQNWMKLSVLSREKKLRRAAFSKQRPLITGAGFNRYSFSSASLGLLHQGRPSPRQGDGH